MEVEAAFPSTTCAASDLSLRTVLYISNNLPTVVWEGGLSPRHPTAFGELVVKLAQRTLTRKPLVTALGDCPSVVLRAGLN